MPPLPVSPCSDSSPTSPARQRLAARFDMSMPENQHKLEAVEQLQQVADDVGVSISSSPSPSSSTTPR
jgi:hypothetical protein